MAFIDDVKDYCCTDDNLTGYINAAERFISTKGITVNESDPLYAQAVKMLVSAWYDIRTPDPSDKNAPQPHGLSGILLALQLEEEAANGS